MTDNSDTTDIHDIEVDYLPDDDELFGEVREMLGNNRVSVKCKDGEERMCRIPGRMRKRVWIRDDDIVVVSPWDFQDEKGDIEYRYESTEVDELHEHGIIQESGDD